MSVKLKYSKIDKPERVYCHYTCSTRNVKGSLPGWNKKTLDNNTKPYEEINISGKINVRGNIKAIIIVFLLCNSTLYFLLDLK